MPSTNKRQKLSPMAEAISWANKITSCCIAMVLPSLGGMWLDSQWGTTPFCTVALLLFGCGVGFYMLYKAVQND